MQSADTNRDNSDAGDLFLNRIRWNARHVSEDAKAGAAVMYSTHSVKSLTIKYWC